MQDCTLLGTFAAYNDCFPLHSQLFSWLCLLLVCYYFCCKFYLDVRERFVNQGK